MKILIAFLFFLVLLHYGARAQKEEQSYIYFHSSDDLTHYYNLVIDQSNPRNDWQTGKPHKTLFTSAFSVPNVIITDTSGSYKASDTSAYTFKTPTYGGSPHWPVVYFYYRFDSDTLLDYGKIEISKDQGPTWSNLRTGSTPGGISWYASNLNGVVLFSGLDTVSYIIKNKNKQISSCRFIKK